jgi:biotin carboxyl carrier protein
MKYKFQLDRKYFEVEIPSNATLHSETELKINRKPHSIVIADQDKADINTFFLDNRFYQIEVTKNASGYPTGIFVNGEYYSAALLKIDKYFYSQEQPLRPKKSGQVKSFIPGSIKKVFFKLQDAVQEGDVVLIHQAMKMENEIRSPKSGIIRKMGVQEGDNILANHLLFEVE